MDSGIRRHDERERMCLASFRRTPESRESDLRGFDLTQHNEEDRDAVERECQVIIFGHDFLFGSLLKNYLENNSIIEATVVTGGKDDILDRSVLDEPNRNTVWLIDAWGKNWIELSALLDSRLGSLKPSAKVILFNVALDSDIQSTALQWGVKGLIYSSSLPEMVVKAIQCVASGEIWASRKELEKCIHDCSNASTEHGLCNIEEGILSQREAHVLALLTSGHSNKLIAEKLYISEHTVKKCISNIFRKLGVSNRFQAALWVAKKISESI